MRIIFCLVFLLFLNVSAEKKPNVLFIAVDDLNHWVTHLGRNTQAKTPNIDRLAKMGVTFTNAYCAVPACNPSRVAIMGGRRASTTGCYLNGQPWQQVQKPGEGLSAQFMKNGYYVAGAGKIYHSNQFYKEEWNDYFTNPEKISPNGKGISKYEGYFEPIPDEEFMQDDEIADWHYVNYCIEKMNEKRDKPFFIACGLYKPHLPFAAPKKYFDMFPVDEIKLPPYLESDLDDIPPAGLKMRNKSDHEKLQKSGRWKHSIQAYLATCAYTDMNIGRLLDALEKSPHRDNTIIVLWGDHGWSFGEKKHGRKFALWEEPTRVPFIWSVPGGAKGPSARTVDLMSVYPTLCELAGIPKPAHVEGESITALLKNPEATWDKPALTTYGYKNHAVRTEKWRYILYANGDEELYDHSVDPYEWKNLAKNSEYDSIKKQLQKFIPKDNAPSNKKSIMKSKKKK